MRRFFVTMQLGFRDLFSHGWLSLIMALLIAVAVAMYASMRTYRTGMVDEFGHVSSEWLVVQETQSFGEFYGSRLPGHVAEDLASMGAGLVVPEIHTLTGTSVQDAILLRGIDLEHYHQTEYFSLVSGRSLQPGDPERLAMVGSRLAENQGLTTGGTIVLRGRNFTVAGVFHTGSYVDNEAWISLADAQKLLGWGTDVSVFIIPDDGQVQENTSLPGGISVVRKGEGVRSVTYQYQPILDLMDIVAWMLGAVAVIAMANIFSRLAWLRRHELAILRTVGFPAYSLMVYLFSQAGSVTLAGLLVGVAATEAIIHAEKMTLAGFTIVPRLDQAAMLTSLGWTGMIVLAGSILPAWWLSHMNLAGLLYSE